MTAFRPTEERLGRLGGDVAPASKPDESPSAHQGFDSFGRQPAQEQLIGSDNTN
jgi:hypothetical protein